MEGIYLFIIFRDKKILYLLYYFVYFKKCLIKKKYKLFYFSFNNLFGIIKKYTNLSYLNKILIIKIIMKISPGFDGKILWLAIEFAINK